MAQQKSLTLGFIGQGWVGRNYSDSFADRGYTVMRYALEAPHNKNKDYIRQCDVVFIAVPTPSTQNGFDGGIVRSVLGLVGEGKVAVIKSTLPPGTTSTLAKDFPKIRVMHIPEFLRESHARYDVDNPERLIVGIPDRTPEYEALARLMVEIHPRANHTEVTVAEEAEFIKYAHNTLGYITVVFANILFDLAKRQGVEWAKAKEAILNNSWYPSKYLDPEHKGGRGAGGHCFIKDFAALRAEYERLLSEDKEGIALLRQFEAKNGKLLKDSGKDIDLLKEIYG